MSHHVILIFHPAHPIAWIFWSLVTAVALGACGMYSCISHHDDDKHMRFELPTE